MSSYYDLWNSLAAPREISVEQHEKFERFLVLLNRANENINLTRVVDPEQAKVLHIGDALTLLPHIPVETKLLADIGSGGGVPGLVLAIALPDTHVVLIESTQKKAHYLQITAKQLRLPNVEVRAVRAEDAGHSDLRARCQIVTARAVGPLVWIAEWCLPLCKKGGKVLAMKGPKLAEELPEAARAIHVLNAGKPIVHPVTTLPGQTGHVICEIPKMGPTPDAYPRSATSAKGKPIS